LVFSNQANVGIRRCSAFDTYSVFALTNWFARVTAMCVSTYGDDAKDKQPLNSQLWFFVCH